MEQTISEKIRQRRRQMLVHSYLYYEMDANIISDSQWSKWGVELAQLQNEYPKEASEVEYAEQFKEWDGSSGAHLEYDDSIISIATRLYCKEFNLKPKLAQSDNIITKSVKKLQKAPEKSQKSTKTVKKQTATKSLF